VIDMPAPSPTPTRPPLVVAGLGLAALVLILGPVLALGIRVPWARVSEVLGDPTTHDLLRVTLGAGLWTTLLTCLLGVPLALLIQHLPRGGRLVRLLVLLPLAMPPVVAGLALTAAVGRRGLIDAHLAFAFPGVVAAHTFIALPFVVVTVDAALRQIDPEIPASAAGVGLSRGEVLRKVVLPAVAPAVATGAGLAFARSLGEFGTTLTFAGSLPGVTRTMPLGIYLDRETDPGRAYVLGALLIGLAVLVLLVAALPGLWHRAPAPAARSLNPLDAGELRALTAPTTGGVPVRLGEGVELPADRITAVVGPNGSGKTTLMQVIAGRLRGRAVDVPGRVILLTQRPGLPRTTTVAGAVTMATRDASRTRALLDAAGLTPLSDVPVPALSGGQAAQVALVRALAARPEVLILDEPLTGVDIASATAWRGLLRAAARDRTTLLVTHDPLEVAGLSEYLLVLDGGEVTAAGPTAELLRAPPDDVVAALAGLNRVEGVVVASAVDTVSISQGRITVTGTSPEQLDPGQRAVATFPPEATSLRTASPAAAGTESARNEWPGTIEYVESPVGRSATLLTVSLGEGVRISVPVTRQSLLELSLTPGSRVHCVTKATAITVHPLHP